MTFVAFLILGSISSTYAKPASSHPFASCHKGSIIENCWTTPCSISLDFDGNGKADTAYLVSVGKNGSKGIAIVLDSKKCLLAGAGVTTGSGGNNFSWMDHWALRKEYQGKQDGLEVTNINEIGGVLYLKNSKVEWEQEGD